MHLTRRACLAAAVLPFAARAEDPLKVVVTFSVLADMVRQIGAPLVQVASLVEPNQDLHNFEPRPSDARAIASADVFIINGLGIDDAILRLARTVTTRRPPVIAALFVEPRTMLEDGNRITDPHAWHDIGNAKRYVRAITEALSAADAVHAAHYRKAAVAYLVKLDALETEVRTIFAAIPRARRRVVTTHDALGYFGAAYGIDFIAPLGMSTEGEPSAKALAALINQIKRDRIRALFLENIGRDVLMETVARETGVHIGGKLFSDALSPPDGPAGTYIDMIQHNTKTIAAALR